MAKCSVASLRHSIIRASFGIRNSGFVIHNRRVDRARGPLGSDLRRETKALAPTYELNPSQPGKAVPRNHNPAISHFLIVSWIKRATLSFTLVK